MSSQKKQVEHLAQPNFTCNNLRISLDLPHFNTGNDLTEELDLSPQALELKRSTRDFSSMLINAEKQFVGEGFVFAPHGQVKKALAQLKEKNIPVDFLYVKRGREDQLYERFTEFYSQQNFEAFNGGNFRLHPAISVQHPQSLNWFDLDPNYILHSKAYLIDQKAVISSYNIDPRSYLTNYEVLLTVDSCSDFNKYLKDQMALTRKWKTYSNNTPKKTTLPTSVKILAPLLKLFF